MTHLETATVLVLAAVVALEPVRRWRAWRRACQPIVGLREWERTREALRKAVES